VVARRLKAQALLDAMDGVAYIIDRAGVIVALSQHANRHEPGSSGHWTNPIVRGRLIYDSISGDQVRDLYRELHEAVWSCRRPGVSFFYRCDAPGAERLMHMSMRLIQDEQDKAGILYHSILVNEVPRIPLPLFASQMRMSHTIGAGGRPIIVMCAFCQDVGWPPNRGTTPEEWIGAAEYYRRGGGSDVLISHGACELCVERVLNEDATARPFTERS
jgi:hypothetical protein